METTRAWPYMLIAVLALIIAMQQYLLWERHVLAMSCVKRFHRHIDTTEQCIDTLATCEASIDDYLIERRSNKQWITSIGRKN